MQIQRWPLNLGDSCGVRSTTRARRCAAGALADSDDRPETEARTQYLSIHSQRRWCSVLLIRLDFSAGQCASFYYREHVIVFRASCLVGQALHPGRLVTAYNHVQHAITAAYNLIKELPTNTFNSIPSN